MLGVYYLDIKESVQELKRQTQSNSTMGRKCSQKATAITNRI